MLEWLTAKLCDLCVCVCTKCSGALLPLIC